MHAHAMFLSAAALLCAGAAAARPLVPAPAARAPPAPYGPGRRALSTGPSLSDSDARKSSAGTSDTGTSAATNDALLSVASAGNGKTSATASLDWEFDKDSDDPSADAQSIDARGGLDAGWMAHAMAKLEVGEDLAGSGGGWGQPLYAAGAGAGASASQREPIGATAAGGAGGRRLLGA